MDHDPDEATLDVADLAANPLDQYRSWLDDARAAELVEPQACVLITSTPDGHPSGRHVLIRRTTDDAFGVFTDGRSRKAREIEANPSVALVVGWVPLRRQITVTGTARTMGAAESDDYFAQRPRGSQIAAWASHQSSVLPDRATLEARVAEQTARWEGQEVQRPPDWGGWWITPDVVEIWQGRESRLHDRLRYRRDGDGWLVERLSP